jgi:hypothetical protein
MSNESYLLLITHYLKTVGVGDLNPNSTDTTCFGWGLKPLNLR